MKTDTPQTIYLKDYQPFPYAIEHTNLYFDIRDEKTIVRASVHYKRKADANVPLILNGEHQTLLSVKIDGEEFNDYKVDDTSLVIENAPEKFELEIISEIDPAANTALEGLYKSGDSYCTQCEAEGFRRITYYPDRPDVLTTFSVRIEADKGAYPVLLSNGEEADGGDLGDGRHFIVWNDTTPKPCYLFALVAGNLVHIEDHFKTMSGKDVTLRIYVRAGDEDQCDYAMVSLIKSMKWDEEVYGREYQYSIFNIVAVGDFNMGAMENTSLNIFNTALVLAQQETATDMDFVRVESVIAHEYFHNWTGNRVTCRDWFQLSLKEGLTVFRDQEFSADLNSRPVQRIDDVSHLRKLQFPEDASPLSHPIRPDNYIEINNFYTMTVYEKGAEVIRMFRTLLGEDGYRKATDLYFDRYDGMAVTCDDWFDCMQDVYDGDLSQFKLWYSQAGTPEVNVTSVYDESAKTFTLNFEQSVPDTAGQTNKKPMHIPIAVGLLDANGQDMIETRILDLKDTKQSFVIEGVSSNPVPSILRNFSAPIKLTNDLTQGDLAFLMVNDSDGFNAYEAGQQFALQTINAMIDDMDFAPDAYLRSFGALLDKAQDGGADRALFARALSLPDISVIGQSRDVIDTDAINKARNTLKRLIKRDYKPQLKKLYELCAGCESFSVTAQAMGRRALRNLLLDYLTTTNGTGCATLAENHYRASNTMTDKVAALSAMLGNKNAPREAVLSEFYEAYKRYDLVIDKWFSLQASAQRDDIFDVLAVLKAHPDFNIKNPNRVRSLYGAFAMNNPMAFHRADGTGYTFLKDFIIELNEINPQIAARLLTPLREWRKYTPDRQAMMRGALEEISKTPNLSPNVFEIVEKSLK